MIVRHLLSVGSASKDGVDPVGFLLRTGTLDYCSFYPQPATRYAGWFMWRDDWQAYAKLLESVEVLTADGKADPVVSLNLTDQVAIWECASGVKVAFIPLRGRTGLQVLCSHPTRLRLTLDMRHTYQSPLFDRDYQVSEPAPNNLAVHYTDPGLNGGIFLHLRSTGSLTRIQQWSETTYPRDIARNSPPNRAAVYTLLETTTTSLAIGAGDSALTADQNSVQAGQQRFLLPSSLSLAHSTPVEAPKVAARWAQATIERLRTPTGVWAGLPWFHQQWSRDTLLTALGMARDDQLEVIQAVLNYQLDQGQLPTYLGSGTSCADGIAWLCLLVREYGIEKLDDVTAARLEHLLSDAHTQLQGRRAHHGFIASANNATWMDTIGRTGFALEVQAGYALLLEVLAALSFLPKYTQERERFLTTIRQEYFKIDHLCDMLGDATQRPNVYLTYLLTPDLLNAQQWQRVFRTNLNALWLQWGGLASIDTNDKRFVAVSSGQDNKSYHQGDSWMFINCLAAVALQRLGGFESEVSQLLTGATEEILWKNIAGSCGEIQSAGDGASWGCGTQAWSAGCYLFLSQQLAS